MTQPHLASELDDRGVLTLTLNRPDKRNALSAELVEALLATFERLPSAEDVHVVVLTGAGDQAFCAGADLDPAALAQGPYALHRSRERYAALLQAMARAGRPVVARVQGVVAGGGMGLLMGADLAVAAADVRLMLPELKVGLFPMMVTALLQRHVGRKKALELLLTAATLSAAEAEGLGLLNRAVPRDELDEHVEHFVTTFLSFSRAVLQLGRDAYYRSEDMAFGDALTYLCSQLTVNGLTEDAATGLGAFLTRSTPSWKHR